MPPTVQIESEYGAPSPELTSRMLAEEERLLQQTQQEAATEHQREKQKLESVTLIEKSKQQKALGHLVSQAEVYAKFIEQQMHKRALREAKDRQRVEKHQAKKQESTQSSDANGAPAPTRRTRQTAKQSSVSSANAKTTTRSARQKRTSKENTNDVDDTDNGEEETEPVTNLVQDNGERFFEGQRIPDRQPKLVTGCIMKEYQLDGMLWMVSLWENGLNGILGDEMGLGKTLQCIAFIAYLTEANVSGPFLIVAPLSTIQNWVNEFRRFAPTLRVLLYHGTPQERAQLRRKHKLVGGKKEARHMPVIVTSFEIAMRDRKHFQTISCKYIMLDEGHRIKNMNCRLVKELKQYHSVNRLLLTGTPLQNNLSELWSLLNFLMPDIFDSLNNFQEWFDFDNDIGDDAGDKRFLEKEMESQLLRKLHGILKPFLLRRLKTDVEDMLPPKKEIAVFTKLTRAQEALYKATLERDLAVLYGQSNDTEDGTAAPLAKRLRKSVSYHEMSDTKYFKTLEAGSQDTEPKAVVSKPIKNQNRLPLQQTNVKLNNIVMQLRKICNHPYLLHYPLTDSLEFRIDNELISSCGKLMLLDQLLPRLQARGHRVLLFSQMTSMLDILHDYCVYRNFKFCRLDGSTSQTARQEQIKLYSEDTDYFIFLLSTRAGGLGINLVSADTVIIYDSDWNPQVDLQAMDRCHRIGQTRPVIVYRLVTANTVEDRLLERAQAKRKLEKLVVHKESFKGVDKKGVALGVADIERLLAEKEQLEVWTEGDEIISNDVLERIMDRSVEPSPARVSEQLDEKNEGFALLMDTTNDIAAPPLVETVL